ncbi:hypothetical protein ACH5RR_012617 [Cinchona calisaya]|uniref:Myb/SANT-like domain-containing protein n=1 Tax=Cinchona calisaya TaxID=153742 RepID=A0ABD3A877_9GENT
MKKEWQLWNKLIGIETGLGWDPTKKTIDASDDWWNKRLEIVPEAAKFREKGLEHYFKLDILFMDVTAIGNRPWTPSSGTLPSQFGSHEVDFGDKNNDFVEINEDSPTTEQLDVLLENDAIME